MIKQKTGYLVQLIHASCLLSQYQLYQQQGHLQICLVASAGFALSNPQKLIALPPMMTDIMDWTGQIGLDQGLPKPHAEIIVCGAANIPLSNSAESMILRWGGQEKSLVLSVPTASEARSVPMDYRISQPLDYRSTHWHRDYPAGMRASDLREKAYTAYPGGSRRAASFGPISPHWPMKMRQYGQPDQTQSDHLILPVDYQSVYAQLTPEDQWHTRDRFPTEMPIQLTGWPDVESIQTQIPPMKVQFFVGQKTNPYAQMTSVYPVDVVCDTVWLFPSQDIGVVIYRGLVSPLFADASDIDAWLALIGHADEDSRTVDEAAMMLNARAGDDRSALQASDRDLLSAQLWEHDDVPVEHLSDFGLPEAMSVADLSDVLADCRAGQVKVFEGRRIRRCGGVYLSGTIFADGVQHVVDCRFEGVCIEQAYFEDVVFTKCIFVFCRFDTVTVDQCQFEQCQFQACEWIDCYAEKTGLIDCCWLACVVQHSQLYGCNLVRSEFIGSYLSGVSILAGRVVQGNFDASEIQQTAFAQLHFSGNRFQRCVVCASQFDGIDLHESDWLACEVSQNSFYGDFQRLVYAVGCSLPPGVAAQNQVSHRIVV